jgi:hypothetical protein
LLLAIGTGLNLHQTLEGAAEAAGIREPQALGDIDDPVVGFNEQVAGRVETDFCKHLTIARA